MKPEVAPRSNFRLLTAGTSRSSAKMAKNRQLWSNVDSKSGEHFLPANYREFLISLTLTMTAAADCDCCRCHV
jgi:hypothetical protein